MRSNTLTRLPENHLPCGQRYCLRCRRAVRRVVRNLARLVSHSRSLPSAGLITELELVAVLERRRMQQLVASTLPSQLFGAAPPSLSAPAGSSSLQQGLPMARGFMPPPDGALSPGWGLPPPHTSPSGEQRQLQVTRTLPSPSCFSSTAPIFDCPCLFRC